MSDADRDNWASMAPAGIRSQILESLWFRLPSRHDSRSPGRFGSIGRSSGSGRGHGRGSFDRGRGRRPPEGSDRLTQK